MEFIEILKALMEQKRLSQTALAKMIGIKQSQVCEWLKGKSKPGYDNLKAICKALGVSGDYLLGIDNSQKDFSLQENLAKR